MAKLVGFRNVRIDQKGWDEAGNNGTVTCFALPGTKNIRPSMSSVHMNVLVAVYDDYSVYVGFRGEISDPVVANMYQSVMIVSSSDFHFEWQGSKVVAVGNNTRGEKRANVDARNGLGSNAPEWANGRPAWSGSGAKAGWFRWIFNCADPGQDAPDGNYIYAGKMQEFGANAQGRDGVLYIGGTGDYEMLNPVYADPLPITIPGFMEFLDYYPFAIRKGGTMQSANREGGSSKIRKGGSWRDVKNVAVGDSSKNKAFVRKSNQWAVAPKIGANAK